jgi:hypothetical protein
MARHLETMRNKHAITLEHLRMGALKGVILDADGSVLYDLFDEFDITRRPVSPSSFRRAADNGPRQGPAATCWAYDRRQPAGRVLTGVHVLCSQGVLRALTTHKEVKTAYQNWQQGAVLINDMRSGFTYSGITFEEYRGQATFVQAGGTRRAASSPQGKPMPSRWARWTPSAPTSRQRTSTRP